MPCRSPWSLPGHLSVWDNTEAPPAVQDTIRVRFSTEPIGDELLTEIRSRADSTIDTQTLHNAFDDLTSDDEGAAANNLGDTLARQASNLNINTSGYRSRPSS